MVDGIEVVVIVGGVVASMRIYCNEEHPENACLLMFVSEAGRVITTSDVQPLNAELPIAVKLPGS